MNRASHHRHCHGCGREVGPANLPLTMLDQVIGCQMCSGVSGSLPTDSQQRADGK
jgi:hypothetical protein